MIVADLTPAQRFVIDWLSKEDFSTLGECRGADLDHLVRLGFAEIHHADRGDYALVELTEAGFSWRRDNG